MASAWLGFLFRVYIGGFCCTSLPADFYFASLQALMMLDQPYLYGSRNLSDQHRDMRLDVDGMSYEVSVFRKWLVLAGSYFCFSYIKVICLSPGQELLALGERIGNVNTGLPEDVFSKCLMETICLSSDKGQEETSCAICLVSTSCVNGG